MNRRGYSLMEALLVMAIMNFIFVGANRLLVESGRTIDRIGRASTAPMNGPALATMRIDIERAIRTDNSSDWTTGDLKVTLPDGASVTYQSTSRGVLRRAVDATGGRTDRIVAPVQAGWQWRTKSGLVGIELTGRNAENTFGRRQSMVERRWVAPRGRGGAGW